MVQWYVGHTLEVIATHKSLQSNVVLIIITIYKPCFIISKPLSGSFSHSILASVPSHFLLVIVWDILGHSSSLNLGLLIGLFWQTGSERKLNQLWLHTCKLYSSGSRVQEAIGVLSSINLYTWPHTWPKSMFNVYYKLFQVRLAIVNVQTNNLKFCISSLVKVLWRSLI